MRRNNFTYIVFLLTCAAVCLSLRAGIAADPVRIVVAESEFTSKGNTILLKDIAVLTGGAPELRAKLEQAFISRAPGPGQFVRISEASLKSRIIRAGEGKTDFLLETPATIRVHSESRLIQSPDVIRAADEFLRENNLWQRNLRPSPRNHAGSIQAPAGPVTFDCTLQDDGAESGRLSVKVEIKSNNTTIDTREIIYLLPGTPVNPPRKTQTELANPERSLDNPRISSVKIQRGDTIKIRFTRKNMAILIEGTAMEPGSPGETIRVKAKDSGKIYNAVLLEPSLAEVEM